MGFAVPIDQWLRGPLKGWAQDLLRSPATILDGAPIAEKWAEHLAGARNWQYFLWNVLMFEAWNAANRTPDVERTSRAVA
jgi:asparagine synthase (glutamine-hydrolysing)